MIGTIVCVAFGLPGLHNVIRTIVVVVVRLPGLHDVIRTIVCVVLGLPGLQKRDSHNCFCSVWAPWASAILFAPLFL